MAEEETLRTKVAESCQILGMMGLVDEITGHVSARVPGRAQMWLRCRGDDEEGVLFTQPEAVCAIGWDGRGLEADPRHDLPLEYALHGEIYRARPEVGAVIHAHPPASLLCGLADLPLAPMRTVDEQAILIALEGVPVFPRARLINSPALAQELIAAMGDHSVCLMRGHGITVTGRTVEEATIRAIKLEKLAEGNWKLFQAGIRPQLSEEDLVFFHSRTEGDGGLPRRAEWIWRYYRRRLEERIAGRVWL